jgi:hypothetical protein
MFIIPQVRVMVCIVFNHHPAASHLQTLSHNGISSTPIGTHNVSSDRHCEHVHISLILNENENVSR